MPGWFETIHDLQAQRDRVALRRYCVIEASGGLLQAVHLRPFPKWISLWEVAWLAGARRRDGQDRCIVYCDQPRRCPNFLAVKYASSSRGTSLATMHAAMAALDEIAYLKRADALLCEVTNSRISPAILARYGWAAHKPSRWRRHYIKRLYGDYPSWVTAKYEDVSSGEPVRLAV